MKKSNKVVTAVFLVLVFIQGNAYSSVDSHEVVKESTLREQAEFGGYEIKIYRDEDSGDGVVQILRNKELLYEQPGNKFSLGTSDGDLNMDNSPEIGTDITGDGKPNLTISHWSGGAHCCFDVFVYSIGTEFKPIDFIAGEHGFAGFEDLDGDKIPEFIAYDWTFAYWYSSFAGSPAPKVVLKYKDGRYRVAYDLMKRSQEEIDSEYKKMMSEYGDYYAPENCDGDFAWTGESACVKANVWSYMLQCIYGGHSKRAWEFLDEIWKFGEKDKLAFIDDFKAQLALSDYSSSLPVDLKDYEPDVKTRWDKASARDKIQVEMFKKMSEDLLGE